jgi:hypothetical protein
VKASHVSAQSAWRRLCLTGGRTGEILGMISVTDLTAGFDSLNYRR